MAEVHQSIDIPACFYLGKEYDLGAKQPSDQLILYDARNLTTHGVIVGMTGSGKTGLSITLLEEAAIDGIPAVIIDPKGDLTNLLLQFPEYAPSHFVKWLRPEDARAKNLTIEQYAQQLSERWKQGLRETGQKPERVRELTQHTDFRLYTPGSEAGLPLSILRTFAAPRAKMPLEDLTHKINATATALLGLSGISADPVQSREHVLVAQLLNHAWTHQRDLDLTRLIQQIQSPPIRTVGAYNLETFFPARDRQKFASQLNNMLASPIFTTWTQGEALDLGAMLYRNGRPQHLIFYLAHLDDNQRMFFTTLLLDEMLAWTRRQPGTTNLRAILYFDEVFGYLPPHPGNPPSKQPLLTLLKQARAFGVGVLLATQNPVDLDYKALSNAGTWFVGKLQTERDKARLLEGLESVSAEHGTMTDRNYLERVISSLSNRIFLYHNIHQGQPKLFQTRWALSYLRGPMTREEIQRVTEPIRRRDQSGAAMATKLCNHCGGELQPGVGNRCPECGHDPWDTVRNAAPMAQVAQLIAPPSRQTGVAAKPTCSGPPVLPHDVQQFFLPVVAAKPGFQLEYQPWLLGFAEVTFQIDKRAGDEYTETIRLLARAPAVGMPVDWSQAMVISVQPVEKPQPGALWAAIPESIDTARKLRALEKAFHEYLYGTRKLQLWKNEELELVSRPGEGLTTFRQRCKEAAERRRDEQISLERIKFAPKIEAASQSTARGSSDRVARLEADFEAKKNEIIERCRRLAGIADELQIKPRKSDIRITHFGLAWAPFWKPLSSR